MLTKSRIRECGPVGSKWLVTQRSSGSLNMGGVRAHNFTATLGFGLNQSSHCGNAAHTQFSHGLKLERRWKIAEEAQFCCHTRAGGCQERFPLAVILPRH